MKIEIKALIFSLIVTAQAFSLTAWQWQQNEVANYFKGLSEIQTQGWGNLNNKVGTITNQLIQYSGKVFRVVPGQTFNMGQAHVGGWLILDLSVAEKQNSVLAFWLAHEWAHLDLGHQANIYNPNGNRWKIRTSSTQDEDEADEWAGKFLAASGYSINEALGELINIPDNPADNVHSNGNTRAQIVLNAYQGKATQSSSCHISIIQCQHPLHSMGDQIQCSHLVPMHPMGDIIPCSHVCFTQLGSTPCHPAGDVIPCQHPMPQHQFDLIPCAHPMHPLGDQTLICD